MGHLGELLDLDLQALNNRLLDLTGSRFLVLLWYEPPSS